QVFSFGIRTNQADVVARFELVTILLQHFDVADAVVARARLEHIAKRQRRKCRIAARAPAANDQPIAVRLTAFDKVPRAVHAIIDVDDSPLAVEPAAILGAVPVAAAVVHIQNPKAPARPILDRQLERSRARRRWPAVADGDQRRAFTRGSFVIAIRWRIEERIRGQAVLSWKLDRSWDREISLIYRDGAGCAKHSCVVRCKI